MSVDDTDRYDGEDAGPDVDAGDESGIAQLDEAEMLSTDGVDPLDEGWSPPERPRGLDAWGVTPAEEHAGESLDQRLRREDHGAEDRFDGGIADAPEGELRDDEVGDRRAGRLVERGDDDGAEDGRWADDAGVDGAAASAEEAAVHVIDGREDADRP